MKNVHIKNITDFLLRYLFLIDALSKQNHVMQCAMRKPQSVLIKVFSSLITEMNTTLTFFHISHPSNNMPSEELKKILLHAVPNG